MHILRFYIIFLNPLLRLKFLKKKTFGVSYGRGIYVFTGSEVQRIGLRDGGGGYGGGGYGGGGAARAQSQQRRWRDAWARARGCVLRVRGRARPERADEGRLRGRGGLAAGGAASRRLCGRRHGGVFQDDMEIQLGQTPKSVAGLQSLLPGRMAKAQAKGLFLFTDTGMSAA